MKTKALRKIGKCIYCGTTEGVLSKEHIIPYSLDAELTLEEASCSICAAMTSNFEGKYARGTLDYLRTKLEFPTRRKKRRPKTRPVRVKKDGKERVEHVPMEDYEPHLSTVDFGLPGYLHLRGWHRHTAMHPKMLIANAICLYPEDYNREFFEKYEGDSFTVETTVDFFNFARMLAKIAYCWAVGLYGLDSFEEVFVLPVIRGKVEEVRHWVGGDGYRMVPLLNDKLAAPLHTLLGNVLEDGAFVVRIRLFGGFGAPEHLVVVGRLRNDLRDFLLEEQREAFAKNTNTYTGSYIPVSPNTLPNQRMSRTESKSQTREVYLGGIRFLDVPVLVAYKGAPIFTFEPDSAGQAQVFTEVFNGEGQKVVTVKDDEVQSNENLLTKSDSAYEVQRTTDRYALIECSSGKEVCVILGTDVWLNLFLPNGRQFEATPTAFVTNLLKFEGISMTGRIGVDCHEDGSMSSAIDGKIMADNYGSDLLPNNT